LQVSRFKLRVACNLQSVTMQQYNNATMQLLWKKMKNILPYK